MEKMVGYTLNYGKIRSELYEQTKMEKPPCVDNRPRWRKTTMCSQLTNMVKQLILVNSSFYLRRAPAA